MRKCVERGDESLSLSLSYPYLLLSLIRDGQLKPFRATVWSIPCLDLPKESERKRGLYLWSHSFSVPGERAAIERFVLTFHAGLSSCFIALWHSVVWLWVMRGWRGTDEREESGISRAPPLQGAPLRREGDEHKRRAIWRTPRNLQTPG